MQPCFVQGTAPEPPRFVGMPCMIYLQTHVYRLLHHVAYGKVTTGEMHCGACHHQILVETCLLIQIHVYHPGPR